MTATSISLTTAGRAPAQSFRHSFRAEATKLRSLRSTTWTLVITIVGALTATGLIANHNATRNNRNFMGFDPTNMALGGIFLATLAFGVMGVLAASGEYGSGTIRSSLSATPLRSRFFASKVAVVGLLSLVVGEVLSFSLFYLGQGILAGGHAPTAALSQPGVARAVLLSGVFLALMTLLALGLGLIIRHSAGAIGAYVGVTLLAQILLQPLGQGVTKFIPVNMLANSVAAVMPESNELVAPVALGVMALYAFGTLALAKVLLDRRDA
ncbi:MAG TPA: ABC transporter permease [Acidimicrobiales bacterium]|jgi:hypothetical protein